MIFKLFLSSLSLPYLLSRNTRVCTIIIVSVDSRNFEMWGQFPPPPCPKNVGAWSIKMGTCTSANKGLISEAFVCPYVCLQDYTNTTVWIFMKK